MMYYVEYTYRPKVFGTENHETLCEQHVNELRESHEVVYAKISGIEKHSVLAGHECDRCKNGIK